MRKCRPRSQPRSRCWHGSTSGSATTPSTSLVASSSWPTLTLDAQRKGQGLVPAKPESEVGAAWSLPGLGCVSDSRRLFVACHEVLRVPEARHRCPRAQRSLVPRRPADSVSLTSSPGLMPEGSPYTSLLLPASDGL